MEGRDASQSPPISRRRREGRGVSLSRSLSMGGDGRREGREELFSYPALRAMNKLSLFSSSSSFPPPHRQS